VGILNVSQPYGLSLSVTDIALSVIFLPTQQYIWLVEFAVYNGMFQRQVCHIQVWVLVTIIPLCKVENREYRRRDQSR
jgi:hypothetical protein